MLAQKRALAKQPSVSIDMLERRIYLMRGEKVMLDVDLAKIYQVETRALVQAVKRNQARFPEDFMFQLSVEEAATMRSQIVIASKRNLRHQPYAFSEHGALMLASILKSQRAAQMSIFVVRAFIRMRQYLATHKDLARKMEDLERKQNEQGTQLATVYDVLKQMINPPAKPKRRIGFSIQK